MFRHPTGGVQLVKGTIESGEHPHQAALRELHEESGIHDAMIVRGLGACEPTLRGKPWEFVQVNVARTLPDEWAHFTGDGGGLLFRFFWHHLDEFPTRDWHIKYVRAFVFIRDSLAP
jgi:8-oxo-dGTP pyrophosphatase MutT (NUDIX family)